MASEQLEILHNLYHSEFSDCDFLIVTGNSLVLVAIAKFEQLRTLPNIFVASMASSDLLVGLLTIPVFVG